MICWIFYLISYLFILFFDELCAIKLILSISVIIFEIYCNLFDPIVYRLIWYIFRSYLLTFSIVLFVVCLLFMACGKNSIINAKLRSLILITLFPWLLQPFQWFSNWIDFLMSFLIHLLVICLLFIFDLRHRNVLFLCLLKNRCITLICTTTFLDLQSINNLYILNIL